MSPAPLASPSASEETKHSPADEFKNAGNEFLKTGKLTEAVEAYSRAIDADASIPALWSNRSMARLKMGDAPGALADADEAIRLTPTWPKGFFRRAKALEALARSREAAQACSDGISKADGALASELKDLRRLRDEMATSAVTTEINGWWHGTVSATLGGYDQELHFMPGGKLECVVYDKSIPGTYSSKDVEISATEPLRGGLDVSLEGGTVIPYLFRVEAGGLHLCCPMRGPEERPRTFDGPGYLSMRPGRAEGDDRNLTEGQHVVQYLKEMTEIMDSMIYNISAAPSTTRQDELEEKMAAKALGDTFAAGELVGTQSVDEQAKQMQHSQRQEALKVKYAGAVADATARLVSGEAKAADLYPDEAQEIGRLLRNLWAQKAPAPEGKRQAEPAPILDKTAGSASPAPASATVEPSVAKAAPSDRGVPTSCGGCFAGLAGKK